MGFRRVESLACAKSLEYVECVQAGQGGWDLESADGERE